MNRVMLAGRLGRDPERRETRSGMVVSLNVATRERKKEGDRWVDGTEWHRVVCFGKTAELADRYLTKGRECIVEGKLRTTLKGAALVEDFVGILEEYVATRFAPAED